MPTRKALVLVSGGLDSTVLGHWLESKSVDSWPLCFDYGQHCFEIERASASRLLPRSMSEKLGTVSIRGIYEDAASVLVRRANLWRDDVSKDDLPLPYRNSLLLTAACAAAATRGIADVYSAFINSNLAHELDATTSFIETMSAFGLAVGGVTLHMPFRSLSKAQVARLGYELGAPIRETYSCQINSRFHCGACPNCVDRLTAFREMWDVDESVLAGLD